MEMMDSLKKVCLENNRIKDAGAIALSKALEDNDTLLSLHLESNEISCEGASALGEMLSNKFKLSKLNLNNNPMGDEGFIKIALEPPVSVDAVAKAAVAGALGKAQPILDTYDKINEAGSGI